MPRADLESSASEVGRTGAAGTLRHRLRRGRGTRSGRLIQRLRICGGASGCVIGAAGIGLPSRLAIKAST